MSGSADSVLLAQFLVQSNIEMFRRERDGGQMSGKEYFLIGWLLVNLSHSGVGT